VLGGEDVREEDVRRTGYEKKRVLKDVREEGCYKAMVLKREVIKRVCEC